jgi:hypothetical protein
MVEIPANAVYAKHPIRNSAFIHLLFDLLLPVQERSGLDGHHPKQHRFHCTIWGQCFVL